MDKHLFSGHAQLPNGTDLYESYKYLSVVMVIDIDTGTILESQIPPFCSLSSNFVSEIFNGRCIDTDLEDIFKQIEQTVHTATRRALITAVQTLHNRYIIVKNNKLKSLSQ
jgi:hypothetical protein